MSAGTFDGSLAADGGRWWMAVEVAGAGRRVGATTAALKDTWRFCTDGPYEYGWTAAEADPYVPRLVKPGGVLREEIDLKTGRTALGSFGVSILDGTYTPPGGAAAHGWDDDVLTDLLAIQGPAHSSHSATGGQWKLAQAIATAAATTVELVARTGIAVGDALWLGAEVVICTAAPGSGTANSIDVDRGCYGTVAVPHDLQADGGEGVLYDRPQHWYDRRVRVYIGLWDTRAGSTDDMLDESELRLIWQGTLSNWEIGDLNSVALSAKPSLGRLDRAIGRQQFVATASFPNTDIDPYRSVLQQAMDEDRSVTLSLAVPDGVGIAREPDYPDDVSGVRDFYARLGGQVVRCEYIRLSASAPHFGDMRATAFGLLDTDRTLPAGLVDAVPFRDVLVVAPSPGDATPARYFVDSAGDPSAHPVDVLLSLATSTGTATEASPVGTNGAWDTLPEHWGTRVPIADFDLASFRRIRGKTPDLALPRLVLGWDGEPIRLRDWFEENILAPLGWFLFLDEDGLIALGDLADVYPGQTLPTITADDWLDDPVPTATGQLDMTTTWQTWRYDFDFVTDEPRRTVRYRHAQAIERLFGADSEIAFDLRGGDDRSGAFVFSRANALARLWVSPLPMVRLAVGLHRLDLSIAAGVDLTCALLPNPFTGTRGLTSQPAFVVGRGLDFDRGRLELDLILRGTPNTALVAPAGTVASYAAGLPAVITLNANDHTGADAGGQVPARDALGFSVGDQLMLTDSDGVPLSDNEVTVAAVESGAANEIELSAPFTLAAAPVTPVAGNVLQYVHWSTGGTPSKAWTATMKHHAAQANDTSTTLPDGEAAYVYGG